MTWAPRGNISKCLDGVPLVAEVLTKPVETVSPCSRLFCPRGLELIDCFIVMLVLFVEARVIQHGEKLVAPLESQGVHHGATNEHCYARKYFRISAGMSPCLISMSLVAIANWTSTTTMSTSRDVKYSFGVYSKSPSCQAGRFPQRGSEARDFRAVIQRVNEHFPVGSWGCQPLIAYGRGAYPGLRARDLPPPSRDWLASACFWRHKQANRPLDKTL